MVEPQSNDEKRARAIARVTPLGNDEDENTLVQRIIIALQAERERTRAEDIKTVKDTLVYGPSNLWTERDVAIAARKSILDALEAAQLPQGKDK